jgi:hypothetical protein
MEEIDVAEESKDVDLGVVLDFPLVLRFGAMIEYVV